MQIFVRVNEGCAAQPNLRWDSVWNAETGEADWALAGADEALNRGGLQATSPIETAVIICLFTDKRAPPELEAGNPGPAGFPPRLDDGDPRGWWADGLDLGDGSVEPLGSHLWLLERAPLSARTAQLAELYAREALATLIAQQVCVRVDVSASINEIEGRLELLVDLFGRDGANVYSRKFDVYWRDLGKR